VGLVITGVEGSLGTRRRVWLRDHVEGGRSKGLVMAGVLRRLALGRGAELLARSLSSTAVAQAKVAVVSALATHQLHE